ncbi:1,4-alpha-glucan branching enzyme GlgB [bacterium HR27]|nr:1,4-alpha-glucan branching enzyme GlgB [bacterium HR27]
MGAEIAQWREWNHDTSLDWHLLQYPPHEGVRRWLADLNHLARREPALYELDCSPEGFEWIDCNDAENSVLVYLRKSRRPGEELLVVCNFTPVPRQNYRVGVPAPGFWQELLNSDARDYGGSGWGNLGGVAAVPVPWHGRSWSLTLTLPPLAIVIFKRVTDGSRP